MSKTPITYEQLSKLSDIIASTLGLHFPEKRRTNLLSGIYAFHQESEFSDVTDTAQYLLSSPPKNQIEKLAKHLTIGETYFFRDKSFYEALEHNILPELLKKKARFSKKIRIWSAGCSTGEEPYSICMLLDKVIPDISQWDIHILASDINPVYLNKLRSGIYSHWSFRDDISDFQKKYFIRTTDGHFKIRETIKNQVTVSKINLAEDCYPFIQNNTSAIDLIICRNVLMYFTPAKAREVIQRFNRSLDEEGWLIVSSTETSQILFSDFETVNFPGVVAYKKRPKLSHLSPESFASNANISGASLPIDLARKFSETLSLQTEISGFTSPAIKENFSATPYNRNRGPSIKVVNDPGHAENDASNHERVAREFANKGDLHKAYSRCIKAVTLDKLNPIYHYLMGTILEEQNKPELALTSMKKALYLDRNFIMANIMAGNLSLRLDLIPDAKKYYRNSLKLLQKCKPDTKLIECDGTTADRLTEIIRNKTNGL